MITSPDIYMQGVEVTKGQLAWMVRRNGTYIGKVVPSNGPHGTKFKSVSANGKVEIGHKLQMGGVFSLASYAHHLEVTSK